MLSGFAKNNRGFMNRTRAINQNFANAIGSTTTTTQKLSGCGAGGKCPTCYRCKGGTCYPANQVIIQGQSTPTLADFNNCMGLYGTSKFDGGFANISGSKDFASATLQSGQVLNIPKTQYPYAGTGCSNSKCPKGYSCVWSKMAGVNYWTYNCIPNEWLDVKFDGGFANAIGTPTKFNPVGYTPAKCVGGRCGSGLCCLKNGTNIATGVTADWCVPCSDFQKFDGGFDYVNGGFNYANGGCGDNGMLGL